MAHDREEFRLGATGLFSIALGNLKLVGACGNSKFKFLLASNRSLKTPTQAKDGQRQTQYKGDAIGGIGRGGLVPGWIDNNRQ